MMEEQKQADMAPQETRESADSSAGTANVLMSDFFANLDFGAVDATLESLLKAGVHFGHMKSRRHPKMEPYT